METAEASSKLKPVGLTAITMDITKPLTMKLDAMEFNKLTLMTGLNGSGKTFILVNCYAMCEIANMAHMGLKDQSLIEAAQFMMNNCFSDFDTHGTVTVHLGDDVSITACFDQGKVTSVNPAGFEYVSEVSRIRYMSSPMRTFNAIKNYLQMRKLILDKIDKVSTENMIAELLKSYKLYDVLYVEQLIQAMPMQRSQPMIDFLKQMESNMPEIDHIQKFDVDLDKPDFYLVDDVGRKYLTSYGQGHQSIFNVVMGNLMGR